MLNYVLTYVQVHSLAWTLDPKSKLGMDTSFIPYSSLVPRLSGMRNKHAWRAWYIFSRDQNRARVFRTERQRFACYSTSFAFNARCV